MKKYYSLFCLALISIFSYSQEIPNGDFETWGLFNTWNYTPENWYTGNSQLTEHVFMDSLAYEGDLAMRVYPFTFFEASPGNAATEFNIGYIPANLNFHVKSFIDINEFNNIDSVFVSASFFSNDNMVYRKTWNTDETIAEWTSVTMELDQIDILVDFCIVDVVASYGIFLEGSPNTWISVDAMTFSETNDIENSFGTIQPNVYPNPVKDVLNITGVNSSNFEMEVYDITGKIVGQQRNAETFDMNTFENGIYFIRFKQGDQTFSTQKVIKI